MTRRIFKSFLSLCIVTLLVTVALILGVMYDHLSTQVQRELKNEAFYIAKGVEQNGALYFYDFSAGENRVTWIDAQGNVLFDSASDAEKMENHAEREEFTEALKIGEGRARRYSDTVGKNTIYYARRLSDGTVLRIATLQNTLWAVLLGILQPIAAIGLVVVILCAVLSSAVARRIVKPINDIKLDGPEIDGAYEELSPLLTKINRQNNKIARQMEQLKQKQFEFELITENMSEGFILLDNNMEVLSYNSSALRLLDGDPQSETHNVLAMNRQAPFRSAVETALSGRHNVQTLERNGRVYSLFANPVFDRETVAGVAMILLDITEKHMAETLRREFTSNVSHELKTPLTTIYGVSDMLASGMVKPEDVARFAESVKTESGRLITLIDDIIKLSRLDEGEAIAEKESVDLYALAGEVLKRLEPVAQKQQVSLQLKGAPVSINGIRHVLDEMVFNLCENAIKYNRPGGSVTVTVDAPGNRPSITVTDTGIGIPKADQSRVFERFFRVDKSHSKAQGGTGLGLSIVKHAAAFHGGTVHLTSEENVGTTIQVVF